VAALGCLGSFALFGFLLQYLSQPHKMFNIVPEVIAVNSAIPAVGHD